MMIRKVAYFFGPPYILNVAQALFIRVGRLLA